MSLPFPQPANDAEYQINVLHSTRRQAEPAVNPVHHDHDAPVFDMELVEQRASQPYPAVRVPVESHIFRRDLDTLFKVDEDELRSSQYAGYEHACECAWERMERLLPVSQVHALSFAREAAWPHWSTSQFSRALLYFTVGQITGNPEVA